MPFIEQVGEVFISGCTVSAEVVSVAGGNYLPSAPQQRNVLPLTLFMSTRLVGGG